MHALTEQSLRLKVLQEFLRQYLRAQTFAPLLPALKVRDLLGGQVFDPIDRQDDAHRYAILHHLQR